MRAPEKDTWLAAWQWWPQPPRSSWRPPFTPICTIFMEASDFPSKNKPPFKEKTIDPPHKFLLICQSQKGALGVMDACPSRSWMWRFSVFVFARAGRTSKGLPATPSGAALKHPRCILFTASNISPGTSRILLQMKCFSLLLFSFDFILIVCRLGKVIQNAQRVNERIFIPDH